MCKFRASVSRAPQNLWCSSLTANNSVISAWRCYTMSTTTIYMRNLCIRFRIHMCHHSLEYAHYKTLMCKFYASAQGSLENVSFIYWSPNRQPNKLWVAFVQPLVAAYRLKPTESNVFRFPFLTDYTAFRCSFCATLRRICRSPICQLSHLKSIDIKAFWWLFLMRTRRRRRRRRMKSVDSKVSRCPFYTQMTCAPHWAGRTRRWPSLWLDNKLDYTLGSTL